jgi:hypothetical protein
MDSEHYVAEPAALAASLGPYFMLSAFVLACLLIGSLHSPFRKQLITKLRRIWTISRQVVGWILIIIGILGMILPGPGIPFFILGVLLVGRRHPLLRRGWVALRLRLRNLARRPGFIGRSAQLGRRALQQLRAQIGPLLRNADTLRGR